MENWKVTFYFLGGIVHLSNLYIGVPTCTGKTAENEKFFQSRNLKMCPEKDGEKAIFWSGKKKNVSYFAYACKTEGKNGISHLISTLCVNCLISIPEYSRIIDYSIIWMCIWCGLLQKLYKIKKSELLNSKVYSKV